MPVLRPLNLKMFRDMEESNPSKCNDDEKEALKMLENKTTKKRTRVGKVHSQEIKDHT
jgi:hypothetical protein